MPAVRRRTLKFAENTDGTLVDLPLSMLMQTIFLGGNKGAGKTSAMKRLFEAAYGAGAQCGVIAPLGRWWSLRIAKNGRGRGLQNVFIFGGKHGDVGITATSGRAVARTVATKRIHFVLDVELMRKEDRAQFLGDFLEELWQLKKEEDASHPMVLFIDEAQVVAPQKSTSKLVERMREFAADLCREGRNHGVGMVLGAQRSANVDKDLLALVEMLIVMRTIHHLDRKVYQSWVDEKSERDEEDGAWLRRLRRLEKGQAYLYAPELNLFERVNVLLPDTYDATKTAVLGEKVARVGRLSKLDVKKLGAELTAVVAASEANDPAKLRARVAELERQLAATALQTANNENIRAANARLAKAAKPAEPDKRAEKRLVREMQRASQLASRIEHLVEKLAGAGAEVMAAAQKLRPQVAQPTLMNVPDYMRQRVQERQNEKNRLFGERYGTNGDPAKTEAVRQQILRIGSEAVRSFKADVERIAVVGKMKTMLEVLANAPLNRAALATAVGMNPESSFRAYVARLKQTGMLGEHDGLIHRTAIAANEPKLPMDTDSILGRNQDVLVGKMRDMVTEVRMGPTSRDFLAQKISMPQNSSFRAYVARLKRRGVFVEESGMLKLAPVLRS